MPQRFPKSLAQCADQLFSTRKKRLEAQKVVEKLKDRETELKNHLIDNLPKSKADGIQGKLARVTVVTKEEPQIKDYDAFRKYMNRTKRFELAYNLRPSAPAIRELWEDGKEVPGVDKFNVVTISMNKV